MSQSPDSRGSFWGITAFFNPAGYANKAAHMKVFSERIRKQGLKLLVIELAFDTSPHVLEEGIADQLIKVRSKGIMWQTERLFNIALERLPSDCDKVAWLDADILFENDRWAEETSELLDQYVVVQPFTKAWWLSAGSCESVPGESVPILGSIANEWKANSLRSLYGSAYFQLHEPGTTFPEGHPGFAWASRRSFLQTHKFYDRLILGGGDFIMTAAMFGFSHSEQYRKLMSQFVTKPQLSDILNWMDRFYAEMAGSIYYASGSLYHLWHGDLTDRKYLERHEIPKEAEFDPLIDISLDRDSCWQWSTEKPVLHQKVKDYFRDRREGERNRLALLSP